MKSFLSHIAIAFFIIIWLSGNSGALYAQLPTCDKIYLDQYNYAIANSATRKIYTFDPTQPVSLSNPTLNTISTPDSAAFGLTVSEVLGSNNNTLTFYTVINDVYWYYNPATSTWVNTGHQTGSNFMAFNIASGGGYIYNLAGSTGDVYRYDGTGDGTFLINVPNFIEEGPYDLIADCAGNFYILNVTGINAPPFLRKYNSSGSLVQSWTINNPNHYFQGNGFGITAGFGIIGTQIYVDNADTAAHTESVITGSINTNTVDFSSSSASIPVYNNNGTLMGDFGSCSSGVPVYPIINITASATEVAAGAVVTFNSNINAGGSAPQYQWFVNDVAIAGQTGSTLTYSPNQGDIITCKLISNLPCVANQDAISNPISIIIDCPQPTIGYTPSLFCKGQVSEVAPLFTPPGGSFSIADTRASIDPNTGSIFLNATDTGTYLVVYTLPKTASCPSVSAQDTVTIILVPDIHIVLDNYGATLCQNETITLRVDSIRGFTYQWLPKTDFPGIDNQPIVQGRATGAGIISVLVSNGVTCNASDTISIDPVVCCTVMIPNAFSPNSDGLNDVFSINSGTTQNIRQFSIYNRFGQKVFYTASQDKSWDGTFHGKPCDQGDYFYYLDYQCANGQEFIKKGSVSLIR
jgi:gliding motility-associated-like protein